jgi:hypothetical protein
VRLRREVMEPGAAVRPAEEAEVEGAGESPKKSSGDTSCFAGNAGLGFEGGAAAKERRDSHFSD